MSKINNFRECLQYSLKVSQKFDIEIIKQLFGFADIKKTDITLEKKGIDYIATLNNGAPIYIDAKTRTPGASRYWKYGEPEIALETWSKKPNKYNQDFGVVGWTLRDDYLTDYVLYTYDKRDTNKFYFLPFQLLKNAFRAHKDEWEKKYFKREENNGLYKSEAIFVPASVVIADINRQMQGIHAG